jgi:hypothetical protein
VVYRVAPVALHTLLVQLTTDQASHKETLIECASCPAASCAALTVDVQGKFENDIAQMYTHTVSYHVNKNMHAT